MVRPQQNGKKIECDYNTIGSAFPDLGLGSRHVQAMLLFVGMAITEAIGVALSVGIVAMTDIYNINYDIEIFLWDKQTQDIILSSFLWGYCIMQIPAGQLAHAYGGKKLLVLASVINGFSSLMIPWSASVGGWQAVCACRVIQGIAQGFFLPALHTFIGKWAPVNERSRISTWIYGGSQFGTVVSMMSCGFLSSSSFGWPSIFYSMGLISIVFAAVLHLFASDSPAQHKTISIEEKLYIQSSLGQVDIKKKLRVPWTSILSSLPVWAIVFTHIGCFWGYITLLAEIPTYLNKVLGADIEQNGILSALPYLAMWVMGFFFSFLSDYFINKQLCSITTARKVANTLGTWIPAVGLVCLSYVPANNTPLFVTILIILTGFLSATFVGFNINLIDLAPNFAGTLMSISLFCANLIGIMTPITAGLILSDDTDPTQWRTVFMIAAAILFFTNFIFIIFGTGEVLPWNDPRYLKSRTNASEEGESEVPDDISEDNIEELDDIRTVPVIIVLPEKDLDDL